MRLALLLVCSALVARGDVPVLSVCEILADRLVYNGKTVIVLGQYSSNMHSQWLGENGRQKLVIDGFSWDYAISLSHSFGRKIATPPSLNDYKWNSPLLAAKLTEAQNTTRLKIFFRQWFNYQWVAIFGRFTTLEKFPVCRPWQHPGGFGHIGGAPAQLIWPEEGIFIDPNPTVRPQSELPDLWHLAKRELMKPTGQGFFDQGMRGKQIALRATVVDSSPPRHPDTLIVWLPGDDLPEATLTQDHKLRRNVRTGQAVWFYGTATAFTQSPFMLILQVQKERLFFLSGRE